MTTMTVESERLEKNGRTQEYMIGIIPNGPASCVHLAGIEFPAYTEDVHTPEGSYKTQRTRHLGRTVSLTAKKVKEIKKAVDQRMVRWEGSGSTRRARISLTSYNGYRKTRNDQPLARYIYMVPVDDVDNSAVMGGQHPRPMLD